MNPFVIIIGVVEYILSILIGVGALYLTFQFLGLISRRIDDIKEIKENNIAVALYNGSILFAVAWIIRPSVSSAITSITLLLNGSETGVLSSIQTILIIFTQVLISSLLAFCGISIAILMFMKLTRNVDEFREIKANNVAMGIIIAVIIVVMALFIEPAINTLVDGLTPYPELLKNPG